MGKLLAAVTVIGLLIAGVQLYRDWTDKTGQETARNGQKALEELQEQTRLTRELLSIQRQLLDFTEDNVSLNRRIADVEARLANVEAGSANRELQYQLEELKRQLLENKVSQDQLSYRINDIAVALRRLGVDPSEFIAAESPTEYAPPTDPPPPLVEPPSDAPEYALEGWDARAGRWVAGEVQLPEEDVCTRLRWHTAKIAEVFLEHIDHGPVPGTGEVGDGEQLACIESSDRAPQQWILHVHLREGDWVNASLIVRSR